MRPDATDGGAATTSVEAIPAWDLSSLYVGPADPAIRRDLEAARDDATAFASRWRGRIADGALSAAELAQALTEYERIVTQARRPSFYASLAFAADTQDEALNALVHETEEAATEISNLLVFVAVELRSMPDQAFLDLAGSPALADLRHYLESSRKLRPHTLAELDEQILNQKNMTGRDAFVHLFDELTGSFRFELEVDGERRSMTGEELLSLLYQPDRELRERAYDTFLAEFREHRLVLTSIFNALLLDHRVECDMRKYPTLAAPTHLENEVEPETVETLLAVTEAHYPLAQRYFRLKARLLGLEKLRNTDLYAPLPAAPTAPVVFADARDMILESFHRFSPRFADLARDFFTERWIDAAVRPGKRLGAFCAALEPSFHPYVLASYTGTLRDVTTLAHELGHGIHDRLAARQRLLNYFPPLTLAETASTFGEMILTRDLLARETDPHVKSQLLCAKLEETIATVFRQAVLTRFELAAHEARRHGVLSTEQLGDLWYAENAKLHGEAVEMVPSYRFGWSYIPHFIHSRFYCYAYVFGELLVLTLYRRYRAEGAAFLPAYFALLEAGGGEAPDRLLARLGFDISRADFWAQGCAAIGDMIDELETTLAVAAGH
jgi:oligoendopeptidase F